ncbi:MULTISPECIES: hypothetical protein [Rhizobium]|uniref:hypothetical protein n=1 Tax=Rhizobium TaxID=379 RepID=UPI0013BB84AF|nr:MULTISPECIES: hypothetical protein [Rhizobium]MCH4549495.1 hypothetical protein [Rhizobium changzhiense]NEI66338.1 hypothetical protein [Rhizobium leguminosarum]
MQDEMWPVGPIDILEICSNCPIVMSRQSLDLLSGTSPFSRFYKIGRASTLLFLKCCDEFWWSPQLRRSGRRGCIDRPAGHVNRRSCELDAFFRERLLETSLAWFDTLGSIEVIQTIGASPILGDLFIAAWLGSVLIALIVVIWLRTRVKDRPLADAKLGDNDIKDVIIATRAVSSLA